MPPKISPVVFIQENGPVALCREECPREELYTTARGNAALGELSHFCDHSYIGTKSDSHKVTVEKRGETPYGTRSYLPGGAASENRGGEEAGLSPRVPCAEGREENAVTLSWS